MQILRSNLRPQTWDAALCCRVAGIMYSVHAVGEDRHAHLISFTR